MLALCFSILEIAQGVFQVPFLPFVVGTFVGRGTLFFIEGLLGARYGAAAKEFVLHQKRASLGILIAIAIAILLMRRLPVWRENLPSQED